MGTGRGNIDTGRRGDRQKDADSENDTHTGGARDQERDTDTDKHSHKDAAKSEIHRSTVCTGLGFRV